VHHVFILSALEKKQLVEKCFDIVMDDFVVLFLVMWVVYVQLQFIAIVYWNKFTAEGLHLAAIQSPIFEDLRYNWAKPHITEVNAILQGQTYYAYHTQLQRKLSDQMDTGDGHKI